MRVTEELAEKLAQALRAKFKRSKNTKDTPVWGLRSSEPGRPDRHGIRFSYKDRVYYCFVEEETPVGSSEI